MTNEYASPEDRIRLAEFVGWIPVTDRDDFERGKAPRWRDPEHGTEGNYVSDLPDPLNDHTDCHALRDALREQGYLTTVHYGFDAYSPYDSVKLETHPERMDYERTWSGPDYRTGVVTLALEVLSDE